jgi:hypothetical protein
VATLAYEQPQGTNIFGFEGSWFCSDLRDYDGIAWWRGREVSGGSNGHNVDG